MISLNLTQEQRIKIEKNQLGSLWKRQLEKANTMESELEEDNYSTSSETVKVGRNSYQSFQIEDGKYVFYSK